MILDRLSYFQHGKFLLFATMLFLFYVPQLFSHFSLQTDKDIQDMYWKSYDSAEVLLKKGDYHNAISKFEESLGIARENGYYEGTVKSNMRLGLLYWNIGKLEESTKLFKIALSLASKYGELEYVKECQKSLDIYQLYSAGKEYRSSGKYEKSIEGFEKAIKIAKEIKSQAHEVKCLR